MAPQTGVNKQLLAVPTAAGWHSLALCIVLLVFLPEATMFSKAA